MDNNDSGRRGPRGACGQGGSALILAILIMVIMTLLGFSYLLLADTENQIAINERNYAQALYVAEGGVRIVKQWFDKPGVAAYQFPDVTDTSSVIRTLRLVDHDDDESTARVVAVAGDPTKPIYRDGTDDILEKPYRGSKKLQFSGSEAGPDLRITGAALDDVNDEYFPDFPSPTLRARITRIDLYEPPSYEVGPNKIRYGMVTVKVTAGMFLHDGTANEVQVAERTVKAILNETPYPGPSGPLQSCRDMDAGGDFKVHWGTASSATNTDINESKYFSSIPYATPSSYITGADLTQWINDAVADGSIEDPWKKFLSGGPIKNAPAATQPYPYTAGDPVDDDMSNFFHNLGADAIDCPDMDYTLWKTIAATGGKNVFYFTHDFDDYFFLNGVGTSKTFREWTDNLTTGLGNGFYFFDTADGNPPTDTDSDGHADNLTPDFQISGGDYQFTGFVYLNADIFSTKGLDGPPTTLTAPAEPFWDTDGDGEYDDGELHLNIVYPADHFTGYALDAGNPSSTSITDYDATGGTMTMNVSLNGVIYNSGEYEVQGNAYYYGSVVAKEGMGGGLSGTPDIFFDERLAKGTWPPNEYDLPKVIITAWETDL